MSTTTDTTTALRNRPTSAFVAEAIGLEIERDEKVLVLGEDVGRMGGVFGSTRDLQKRFGEQRVRDTPIAEMGFTGMGVGLAMAGYRPLVEIMFVDFVGVCLEQVYNAAAKNRYMSGGNVAMPMVFKTAGGILGAAAQHSQCLWGTFAHLPGLKVVVPSCPYDYKGLMAASLESDDPVVYIEHKSLLVRRADQFRHGAAVPEERYVVPLGQAATVREGDDLTIATLGLSVTSALEAAEALAADGIQAEVVDLRSVVPLDVETVAASAARTGRLLVVDEDYRSFGLSAELLTRVIEQVGLSGLRAFDRLAVPDVPIPAALTLEQAVLPTTDAIRTAAAKLVGA
ncbi:alpha-ketoacid dehydrogenase subunit beta [Patulibacter defluvii]|uniref:alpha-ketoacid dehydrogenase subunit beta n=1 Tax=Patulibacter defluvii TaxID=3095358 RepID=UPI002A761129|nr:transketolase C-terminal domain-containing protein [Patulibacter sp. DM4]